jgi:hypothetical protein
MSGLIRITCRHAHRLLSERADRPLSRAERWRLRLHLLVCEMCSRFERQVGIMRAAVRRLGE